MPDLGAIATDGTVGASGGTPPAAAQPQVLAVAGILLVLGQPSPLVPAAVAIPSGSVVGSAPTLTGVATS
jgi:hypothetical protein